MVLDTTTLKTFSKLYPMLIRKYEALLPDNDATIVDKINSIIEYLNAVGKLSNDVVKNWNTVMDWTMNDGLTASVAAKIDKMVTDGVFDDIFQTNITPSLGNLAELNTTDKSNLVHAVNEVNTKTNLKANQTDLDTTNSNLGIPTNLLTVDKTSAINAINENTQNIATAQTTRYGRVAYDRLLHTLTGTTPTTLATLYTLPANKLTGAGKECRVMISGTFGAAITAGSVVNVNFGGMVVSFGVPSATANVPFDIDVTLYELGGGYRAFGAIRQGLNGVRLINTSTGFDNTIDQTITISATLTGASDVINIYRSNVFLLG